MSSIYMTELKNILVNFLPDGENKYRFPYSNTLEISSEDGTFFWIRIAPRYPKLCTITFATVQLEDRVRGQGLFRKILAAVHEASFVGKVYVVAPLTPEMHKACQTVGMTYSEAFDQYTFPQDDAKITAHFI